MSDRKRPQSVSQSSTKQQRQASRGASSTFKKKIRVRTSSVATKTATPDGQRVTTSSPLHASAGGGKGTGRATDPSRSKHVLWLIMSAIKEAKLAEEVGSITEARRVFAELPHQVADARGKAVFWIAWSRLEENAGNLVQAIELLSEGLVACRASAWEHDCVMQAMTGLTSRSRWTKSPAVARKRSVVAEQDQQRKGQTEEAEDDHVSRKLFPGVAAEHCLRPASPLVATSPQFQFPRESHAAEASQQYSSSDDDDTTCDENENEDDDDEDQDSDRDANGSGAKEDEGRHADSSFTVSPLQRAVDVQPDDAKEATESSSPTVADTPPRITRVLISSSASKKTSSSSSSSSSSKSRTSAVRSSSSQQRPVATRPQSQKHSDTIAALGGDRSSSSAEDEEPLPEAPPVRSFVRPSPSQEAEEEPLPEAPPVRSFVRPSPSQAENSATSQSPAKGVEEDEEARGSCDMEDDEFCGVTETEEVVEKGKKKDEDDEEDRRGSILVLQKVHPRPSTARALGSHVVVSPVRRSLRLCGSESPHRRAAAKDDNAGASPGRKVVRCEDDDDSGDEARDQVKSLPFVVPSLTDSNYSYVPNAAIKRRNEPVWGLSHVGIAGTSAASPPVRRRTSGLLPGGAVVNGRSVPMSAEAPRRRVCLPWRKPPVSPSPYSYTRSLEAVMTRRRRQSSAQPPKEQEQERLQTRNNGGNPSAHTNEEAAVSPVARILDFIA